MYTVREVATVLGVKPSRLRGYLRAGLVSPQRGERGELRFSFQDLVLLRKAEGLVGGRIAPRRVHDALLRTRAHLGDGVPLSRVQFETDGQAIVASDGAQRWEPSSGQVLFQFGRAVDNVAQGEMHELRQPKPAATPRAAVAAEPAETPSAERFYERGYAFEESGDDASAIQEYQNSIEVDPSNADAHYNVARLFEQSGNSESAIRHLLIYRQLTRKRR